MCTPVDSDVRLQIEKVLLQGVWQALPCPVGEQCRESGGDVTCGRICVEANTLRRWAASTVYPPGHLGDNACAEGEQCVSQSDGTGDCVGVCESGTRRCNGDNREECNAQGQWEILACADDGLLEDGDDVICRAGCEAGLLRCNGLGTVLRRGRMGNCSLPRQ